MSSSDEGCSQSRPWTCVIRAFAQGLRAGPGCSASDQKRPLKGISRADPGPVSSVLSHRTSGSALGIRKRKWGKWVSEIRVPGTQDRLWLGTYSSPEAAAVAHDIAKFCLRENPSVEDFNFPLALPQAGLQKGMSPRSVQKAASDAGMAIDVQFLSNKPSSSGNGIRNDQNHSFSSSWEGKDQFGGEVEGDHRTLNISVDDYV